MSLDWSSTKCAEPLPQTEDETHTRHALVWASVGLDLGSITEKNVDEWVFRLWHQHRVQLDFIHLGDKPDPKEVEGWVRRWIGLSTNVPTLTRKTWLKRISEILEKDTVSSLQYYKHRKEVADG
jgi:hypothetical protein